MRSLFWVLVVLTLLIGIGGPLLFQLPPVDSVDLQIIERFYHVTFVWGIAIGLIVGLVSAWRSPSQLRHKPMQAAADFNGRVATRGILFGLLAAVLAWLATIILAATYSMDPLGPLDKVLLTLHSLLTIVAPAMAMLLAMVAFAVTTRILRWGGTYALLPVSPR